jgi:flagellar hook-associated protein 1 FlgK
MSNILNVGVRALQANQAALSTVGHNIANSSTVGYSRQVVKLATVDGQYTGGGYIGKGVEVAAIERVYDAYLTRQAALTKSVAAQDIARAEKLLQLEDMFSTGPSGLGASINDMLNAFSDVAAAPSDLTARTVVLTRAAEAASRFNDTATQLANLQRGLSEELENSVVTLNTLIAGIAEVNRQIQSVAGLSQSPNDLLDRRDQLISEMNQYVQTTTLENSDGTISVFVAQSQPVVLGTRAMQLKAAADPLDGTRSELRLVNGNTEVKLQDSMLGGGSLSGLMRFQNEDLAEAQNLLGRMAVSLTTVINAQHRLGLDLDGEAGGDLFTPISMPNGAPFVNNTGTAEIALSVADASQLHASDYRVTFTTATDFTVTRLSDNALVTVDPGPPPTADGLALNVTGAAGVGDSFLLRPYALAAGDIHTLFASPRDLAVASPVQASMGTTNTGGLAVQQLSAGSVPVPADVTITFISGTEYMRSDTGGPFTYSPGTPITYDGADPTAWTLTLTGAPQANDTLTLGAINPVYGPLDAGNAQAMMGLRDMKLFDGAPLSDGYAGLIANVGVRAQSAQYAAEVSQSIAGGIEAQRTGVSGVNLDEEAAKLIQFQQAYQASAKMLQVAQSIFDALINTVTR